MNASAATMSTETAPAQAPKKSLSLSLKDLLEDGIYLLFLLKSDNPPKSSAEFNSRIDEFLAQFAKNARLLNKPEPAVLNAKYAFCALMDEVVLSSHFSIRAEWEQFPLQLRIFDEHLAGDHFFERLEALRTDPLANIETLEVFYSCLLLGFQGKYLLEGPEKLNYLISRVHQEVTHAHGGKAEFAPNWKLPQRFQQYIRHELPLWLFFALLSAVGVAIFYVYFLLLGDLTATLKNTSGKPAFSTPITADPSPLVPPNKPNTTT